MQSERGVSPEKIGSHFAIACETHFGNDSEDHWDDQNVAKRLQIRWILERLDRKHPCEPKLTAIIPVARLCSFM